MTRKQAYRIRQLIEQAVKSLTDEEALDCPMLFEHWKTNTAYTIGARVYYNEQLYRCEQDHTSQSDWTPDVTKNLWTAVAEPGTIPVWVQPTGAQDAYRLGDKVHYPTETDPVYVSVIDYNIYAPDVTGWELV